MRRGFLAGGGVSSAPAARQADASPAQAQPPAEDQPPPAPMRAAAAAAADTDHAETDDPAGRARRWSQCLELMRAPGDEKKLVGLLLVTKIVRQERRREAAALLSEALEAVGAPFVRRLLLPLTRRHQQQQQKQQQQPSPSSEQEDSRLQDAAGASLALAILATACRVATATAEEEDDEQEGGDAAAAKTVMPLRALLLDLLQEMAPVALKVAAEGGPGAALRIPASGLDPRGEAAAAADALECALLLCGGGGGEGGDGDGGGLGTVLDSGGLAAASRALLRGLGNQGHAKDDEKDGSVALLTLPLRLMSALLQGPSSSASSSWRQTRLESECADEVADAAEAAAAALASPSTSSRARLEALRALLLALPEDWAASPSGAELRRRAAGGRKQPQSWASDAHQGVARLLSGRGLGPVQKLSALRVAAACVAGLGAGWLLLLPPGDGGGKNGKDKSAPPPLVCSLASTLAIEVPLLLSDALNPSARVPAGTDATDAAGEWRAPEARGVVEEEEQEGGGKRRERRWPKAPPPPPADEAGPSGGEAGDGEDDDEMWSEDAEVGGSDDEAIEEQEEGERSAPSARARARTRALRPRLTVSAGERAMAGLPACFELLEAAVGALVSAGEEEEEEEEQEEQGSGTAAAEALRAAMAGVALSAPPALSEADQLRAFGALRDAIGAALDFVMARADEGEEVEQDAGAEQALATAALLGATRVVGRLLAEAPDALDAAKLARALPIMLAAAGGEQEEQEEGATGAAFLLPAVFQWAASSAAAGGGGGTAGSGGNGNGNALPASLRLLRACGSSAPALEALARLAARAFDAQDWDRAYMAAHTCTRAAECASAAGGAGGGGGGGRQQEEQGRAGAAAAATSAASVVLPSLARFWRAGEGQRIASAVASGGQQQHGEQAAAAAAALMAAAHLAAALLPGSSSAADSDPACALICGALGAGVMAQAAAAAEEDGLDEAAADAWCRAALAAAQGGGPVPALAAAVRASEWWPLVSGGGGAGSCPDVREVLAQAVELRLLVTAVLRGGG